MAIAQARKFARQSVARARGNFMRLQRQQAPRGRRIRNAAFELAKLQGDLDAVLSTPLECSPHRYAKGAGALFLGSNWIGRDGVARVVLTCNTLLPHSQRPAATLLWTEPDVIEQVDLAEEPLESAIRRGRLFVFPSSVEFADGDAYAVLPATFQEAENGKPGLWGFANAGALRGRPFLLGRGAAGTFVDPAGHHLMLVRPVQFDGPNRVWVWMGLSSDQAAGVLRFTVELPHEPAPSNKTVFSLPASRKRPDVALIACTAVDDRGDPLGAVNTRATQSFGITRIDGVPHFFARPNQRDQKGRLVFATRATLNDAGEPVIMVPFREDGADVDVELPANRTMTDGSSWFVRYPNVSDRARGLPLVLIALGTA